MSILLEHQLCMTDNKVMSLSVAVDNTDIFNAVASGIVEVLASVTGTTIAQVRATVTADELDVLTRYTMDQRGPEAKDDEVCLPSDFFDLANALLAS